MRWHAADQMTMAELLALPPSVLLKDAGRALGLGQSKAYDYAAAGEIPGDPPVKVHKYGQAYRVNRADLFRRLGLDPAMVAVPVVPVPAQPPPPEPDGWDALDGPIEEATQ